MRIYAIFGILIVIAGAALYVDRNAVMRSAFKGFKVTMAKQQESSKAGDKAAAEELQRSLDLNSKLSVENSQLRNEAQRLKSEPVREGEPVMCQPGCLFE